MQIEASRKGFKIYVSRSSDPYSDAVEWAVCKGGEMLDGGDSFSAADAMEAAYAAVDQIIGAEN